MADLFEIFGGEKVTLQYEGRSGTLELMVLDAAVSEGHSMSATVTDHEVEDGANISDHVIIKPDILNLNGIVTDNPISLAEALISDAGGVVGSVVGGLAGSVVTGAVSKIGSNLIQEEEGGRHIRAWQAFEFAKRESIPLTIITGLKTYTNMILEDINYPRTVRNANALEFSAKFKNVRIVQSETVDIPPEALDDDVENATKKKPEGKKSSEDPGTKEAEKGASILSQLTGVGA